MIHKPGIELDGYDDQEKAQHRAIKIKARKSKLRCEYILGRRDKVETEKSRELHRLRELKTLNELDQLNEQVHTIKRSLVAVMSALFLNPIAGGPFAVLAFVCNENVKEIQRQIALGNLTGAKARFRKTKIISRISYWGGLLVVALPYAYVIILLLKYNRARELGVPIFYIHRRIMNCLFQDTKFFAESCNCLEQLKLPPEAVVIDRELPDEVYQTCPGLTEEFIDKELMKAHPTY
jgi:hypothetical protein